MIFGWQFGYILSGGGGGGVGGETIIDILLTVCVCACLGGYPTWTRIERAVTTE